MSRKRRQRAIHPMRQRLRQRQTRLNGMKTGAASNVSIASPWVHAGTRNLRFFSDAPPPDFRRSRNDAAAVLVAERPCDDHRDAAGRGIFA